MTMHAIPSHPVICLHPHDHVVIARATLLPGAPVADGITAFERIPAGHKVAVRPLAAGEAVRRYNQIIIAKMQGRQSMSTLRSPSRASTARMGVWRPATTSAF
jgi:hypothetical protein